LSSGCTLASVTEELKEQPSLLRSFSRREPRSKVEEEPVFVGAGDSYAASLCASFLAGPRVLALDPYSLAMSLDWAGGRPVYIISISGETTSNIELARALRGVSSRTTAITSNPGSRLASTVDHIIDLRFRPRGKAPGIASFTLSLAAALEVCGVDLAVDFEGAFSRAAKEAKRFRIARGGGVTHLTGNNEAYAASIYGMAKIYEFLGARAQTSLLEEFSHMPLFSLSNSDTVNVIESPSGVKGRLLYEKMKREGYPCSLIQPEGSRTERVYLLVFAMQMAAIDAARRRGLKAPYFLGAKKKLRISDEMIY